MARWNYDPWDRLLGEVVLASVHRRLQVQRPETGRRGQDDVVDAGRVDDLLVAVEAGEAAVVGQIDLVAELLDLACAGGP